MSVTLAPFAFIAVNQSVSIAKIALDNFVSKIDPNALIVEVTFVDRENMVLDHTHVYLADVIRKTFVWGGKEPLKGYTKWLSGLSTDVDNLVDCICERFTESFVYTYITLEDEAAQEEAELRRIAEPMANNLARKWGLSVNTLEFVQKLEQHVQEAQEANEARRNGMREDGLCASGGSIEAWYESFNARPDAEVVLEYVERFLPLTVARYHETK